MLTDGSETKMSISSTFYNHDIDSMFEELKVSGEFDIRIQGPHVCLFSIIYIIERLRQTKFTRQQVNILHLIPEVLKFCKTETNTLISISKEKEPLIFLRGVFIQPQHLSSIYLHSIKYKLLIS